jgi:hypothetical protein
MKRYLNKAEVESNYNCSQFPLSNLFDGDTIDLSRALDLDFDLVPPVYPTKLDVLLSIVLHTTDFNNLYVYIRSECENLEYSDDSFNQLIEDKGSLYLFLKKLFNINREFLLGLPDKLRDHLIEVGE